MQWHPRINQIFVGCGGRTGGAVRTFYDPKLSSKGALAAAARAPRTGTTDFIRVSAGVAWHWGLAGWPAGWPDCQACSAGFLACQPASRHITALRNLNLGTCFTLQLAEPEIYVPNALPMYREDMPGRPLSKKRRAEKEAQDRRYQPAGSTQAKGGCWDGVGWAGVRGLSFVRDLSFVRGLSFVWWWWRCWLSAWASWARLPHGLLPSIA